MRVALLACLPFVVAGATGGCHPNPCDLDRIGTVASAELTTSLANYDAAVQTTTAWLEPVRPVEPSTGTELDGVVLQPVVGDPILITIQCRDGAIVSDELVPEQVIACEEGFAFAHGTLPAEVQVRLSVPDSDDMFSAPSEGFTRLSAAPIQPATESCPAKGIRASIVVNTDG